MDTISPWTPSLDLVSVVDYNDKIKISVICPRAIVRNPSIFIMHFKKKMSEIAMKSVHFVFQNDNFERKMSMFW